MENKTEIFAPKKLNFKSAEYTQYDTGVVIILPDNFSRYYWSLDSNLKSLNAGENRLYFGLLNQTFTLNFTLQKTLHLVLFGYYQTQKSNLNMPRKATKRNSRRP